METQPSNQDQDENELLPKDVDLEALTAAVERLLRRDLQIARERTGGGPQDGLVRGERRP